MNTQRPAFLTPQQLSERWGGRIGVRTLANWRCNGGGPRYTKIGGAILYKVSDVENYEQNQTVTSTSQYGAKTA
jgi:hypothetical protein